MNLPSLLMWQTYGVYILDEDTGEIYSTEASLVPATWNPWIF